MSVWIENNAATVLGWIGTMLVIAFVFGRRFTSLEAADKAVGEKVEALGKIVNDVAANVNGHNGNEALSRAIDSLTAGLSTMGSRIATNERDIALHEIRLARIDAMRESLEIARQDFYQRKWDPLVAQVANLGAKLQEISSVIDRVGVIVEGQEKRRG